MNGVYNTSLASGYIAWMLRRYPGVFDVVCYTGDGTLNYRWLNHNLTVRPDFIIIKSRNASGGWPVVGKLASTTVAGAAGGTPFELNSTAAYSSNWGQADIATTTQFNPGIIGNVGNSANQSGVTYVAYLFASLPGICKADSYTGNGTSQAINCGFSNGARFVLIKRIDSTGDWYVWDSVRGIVAANDPHLSLNTTAAEVTTDDSVDPDASGFIVNQVAATNINVSGASYIFLAIA